MVDTSNASNAHDAYTRSRLIPRAAISQRADGWTVFGSAAAASDTNGCGGRPSCCTRHPRASGCGSHHRRSGGRIASARLAGSLTLRDDFWLADDRAAPSSRNQPPAVVRAYEACDGAAAATAQVRASRNATRIARAQLATVPLPIVAVIFFGTHYERLPLLRAYERYFERTVYMSPRAEIHQALRRTDRVAGVAEERSATSHHCGRGIKETYACVADVASRALASSTSLRGVLYFHFDLWLQPWRLLRSPQVRGGRSEGHAAAEELSMLWALPPGRIVLKQGGATRLLPLHCFNASHPASYQGRYPQWTWARDVPGAREGARLACTGGGCDAQRLCIGWADLYYFPRRHAPRFRQLAATFGRAAANAELAVPTIFDILRTASAAPAAADAPAMSSLVAAAPPIDAPARDDARTARRDALGARGARDARDPRREAVFEPTCWGFCCSLTTCPELLARHACGHRMQLSEPSVRRAFDELMAA